jgi:hypothetical protein
MKENADCALSACGKNRNIHKTNNCEIDLRMLFTKPPYVPEYNTLYMFL